MYLSVICSVGICNDAWLTMVKYFQNGFKSISVIICNKSI